MPEFSKISLMLGTLFLIKLFTYFCFWLRLFISILFSPPGSGSYFPFGVFELILLFSMFFLIRFVKSELLDAVAGVIGLGIYLFAGTGYLFIG